MRKILLLMFMLLAFSSFTYSAELTDNLVHVWKHDDSTTDGTTSIDSIFPQINGTIDGVTTGVTGINGEAYQFTVGDTEVDLNTDTLNITTNFTISAWVNITRGSCESSECVLLGNAGGTQPDIRLNADNAGGTTNGIEFDTTMSGDPKSCKAFGSKDLFEDGHWAMITFTYSPTNKEIYVNGLLNTSCADTYGTMTTAAEDYFIGSEGAGNGREFFGGIDELYIWNRTLSATEIFTLNSSFYPFASTGNIVFEPPTPTDGTRNNTQITINVSCDSGFNVTLWFDSNANPITEVLSNISNPDDFTTSVSSDDTYFYKASCDSGVTNSSTRSWVYDITTPTIHINITNFFTSENLSTQNQYGNLIASNITIEDNGDLFGFIINITRLGAENFSFTNEALTGSVSYLYTNNSINITDWIAGIYNITVIASDSHTANSINDYGITKKNKQLIFDTDEGNKVTIESDLAATTDYIRLEDRYSFSYDFGATLTQRKVFTITSDNKISYLPDSIYTAHFVIWNSETRQGNWIDFEGGGIPTVRKINDYRYEITFASLSNKITFNSIGGMNVNTKNYQWYRGTTIVKESANISQQSAVISLNLTNETGSGIGQALAVLSYNGTVYASPIITSGDTFISFEQIVTVQETETPLNLPYVWNVSVNQTNLNNTQFQVNGTHAITTWILDNCTTGTTISVNYSIKDEENSSLIDLADVTGTYTYSINGTFFRTFDLTRNNNNSFQICITPSTETFTGNYTLEFSESLEYQERRFYDPSFSFTTAQVALDLFLLRTANGIVVRFKVVDAQEDIISGARVIMRKTGETAIIESATTDGSGIVSLFGNPNQDYEFTFSATGFDTLTTTLRVSSSEIITISLEGGQGAADFIEPVGMGTSYKFFPGGNSLNNGTSTNFSFNLTSNTFALTNCIFRLKLSNDTILSTTNGIINSSLCNLDILNFNTLNYSSIISEAIYGQNGTTNLTVSKLYTVLNTQQGEFSLKTFLDDITNFTAGGFNDRTRLLIAFIAMLVITSIVSFSFGLTNPEGLIILVWAEVGFFSFVGWLRVVQNIPSIGGFDIQKYGIFILVTLMAGGYFISSHKR